MVVLVIFFYTHFDLGITSVTAPTRENIVSRLNQTMTAVTATSIHGVLSVINHPPWASLTLTVPPLRPVQLKDERPRQSNRLATPFLGETIRQGIKFAADPRLIFTLHIPTYRLRHLKRQRCRDWLSGSSLISAPSKFEKMSGNSSSKTGAHTPFYGRPTSKTSNNRQQYHCPLFRIP